MHFLLTGGSGFVGATLARASDRARGTPVTALVRRTSKRRGAREARAHASPTGISPPARAWTQALEGVDVRAAPGRRHQGPHGGRGLLPRQRGGHAAALEAMARRAKPPRLVYCSSLAAAGPALRGQAPRREDDGGARLHLRPEQAGRRAGGAAVRRPGPVRHRPAAVRLRPGGHTNSCPPLMPMARLGVYLKSGPRAEALLASSTWTTSCEALYRRRRARGKTLDAKDPQAGVYFVADPHQYTLGGLLRAPSPRRMGAPQAPGASAAGRHRLRGRASASELRRAARRRRSPS